MSSSVLISQEIFKNVKRFSIRFFQHLTIFRMMSLFQGVIYAWETKKYVTCISQVKVEMKISSRYISSYTFWKLDLNIETIIFQNNITLIFFIYPSHIFTHQRLWRAYCYISSSFSSHIFLCSADEIKALSLIISCRHLTNLRGKNEIPMFRNY